MDRYEDRVYEEFMEYKEKNCRCEIDEDCECMSMKEFENYLLKEIEARYEGLSEEDIEEMYG